MHWRFPILAIYTASPVSPFLQQRTWKTDKKRADQSDRTTAPSLSSITPPFHMFIKPGKKDNTLSLLLLLEPVPSRSLLPAGAGSGRLGALDVDRHVLVLLERGREVGLLGGGGGLGGGEDLDVGIGVAGLEGRGLVGLELLEVELLDEVG